MSSTPSTPPELTPESEPVIAEETKPPTEETGVNVTPESKVPIGAEVLVDLAKADLAFRQRVEAAAIKLVSFEEVVWPDAGLGCPQPGMRYMQVPEDGVRIRLAFGGSTYDYHGGGRKDPFLCE